jgi:hypothetical protein
LEDEEVILEEKSEIKEQIPKPKFPKQTSGSQSREMLREIQNLTYNMNEEALKSLVLQLSDVLEFACTNAEKDAGLVLEEPRNCTNEVCVFIGTVLNHIFL